MFRIFSQLKWHFAARRKLYLSGLALLVLADLFTLAMPFAIGTFTDGIVQGSLTEAWLLRVGPALLLAVAIYYGVSYLWSFNLFTASDRFLFDVRARLMRKFLGQSPRFYAENSNASLLAKTMNDVESVEILAGFGMLSLLEATINPFMIIAFMALRISAPMTLAALLPLFFVFPFYRRIGGRLYALYDEIQRSYDELYALVLENIAGIRLGRAYRMEAMLEARFNKAVAATNALNLRFSRLEALIDPFNKLCAGLSIVVALVFGSALLGRGALSLGQMVSFNLYLGMLIWPMMSIGEYLNISQQASASMERIQELLDYKEEYVDAADALDYAGGGDFAFKDFSFSYPKSEQRALEGISFELKAGQTLGVVGKTGSGKTTLLKQFLHLYPYTGEGLTLDGRPISRYRLSALRRRSAYVPQEHSLFSVSIRDNVRLMDAGISDAAVDEALARAAMDKEVAQFPQGGDTLVGERGITLSGGQKQRVSIARALVAEPDLLILDDSLSAVDSQTEERILQHFLESRRGKTTVISAHRFSALRHADLILVLDEGRIAQRGTHAQLIEEEGWYREQYLKQQMEDGE